ncbi:DUF2911 domain-containing protein [Autumnicola edwardsiae]|jgi:hypothetical protein|uniref:DUF2911 domain-containing protein n=1 Tax=Autumnicola edwardsiae TaxID=3075594 RepID=A0ABU3CQR0_9FLAO|nr:DUF2911 domain-containing protein [Zunongwangia sp. F297]MDT0648697.1 DUF2911 domain-containing protein [Zunongwangia sp. F297]
MKKILIAVFGLMLTLGNAQEEMDGAPNFSKMDSSPMDLALYRNQNEEPIARVIYSRPQKRDREVFGKLVPYGEVWRTGANEATELTLYKDMQVAGEKIPQGTYTLYTVPNEKEWTVILNKKTLTWGAYEYSSEQDLVRINVPVRKAQNNIEALSMAFQESNNGADLLIGWDDRFVKVPFEPTM